MARIDEAGTVELAGGVRLKTGEAACRRLEDNIESMCALPDETGTDLVDSCDDISGV